MPNYLDRKYDGGYADKRPAPERFTMGDNRMFHSREGNINREGLPTWEVYSIGLEQWATCRSAETARAVSDALEAFYSNIEHCHK